MMVLLGTHYLTSRVSLWDADSRCTCGPPCGRRTGHRDVLVTQLQCRCLVHGATLLVFAGLGRAIAQHECREKLPNPGWISTLVTRGAHAERCVSSLFNGLRGSRWGSLHIIRGDGWCRASSLHRRLNPSVIDPVDPLHRLGLAYVPEIPLCG